jgi:hypothetical protein
MADNQSERSLSTAAGAGDQSRGRSERTLTISVLAGGFAFLYLNLFYLPDIPILLFTDQFTLLYDARQMLDGRMIYLDFFQFTLPATQTVYFGLFKIFGARVWIPNAMLIVVGICMMCLMIHISRKVLSGKAAFLPALLFLVVPFRSQFDGTHHWYSTLAVMAALALIMEIRSPARLAGAGALLGLSTCFTQTRGLPAVAAVALFLVWETRRRRWSIRSFWRLQFHLWWAFIAVVVGFNAYFAWQAGLAEFLRDTVFFGLRYFPAVGWNTWRVYMVDVPGFHPWYRLPALVIFLSIHLLIPLIYILFFARYWITAKQQTEVPWDRLVLVALVGLFIFFGIANAPSWLRICAVSPPGVILFVWYWNSPGRVRGIRVKAAWALVILLALGECTEREVRWHETINLPAGPTAILQPRLVESLQYFQQRTRPGDYFFGDEMFKYLLDLRDPAVVSYVTGTDYTRPSQVKNVIQGLESHRVKYALWATDLDLPPARFGGENNLAPLRDYLRRHYHFVKAFGDGATVWERNTGPTEAEHPSEPAGNKPTGR